MRAEGWSGLHIATGPVLGGRTLSALEDAAMSKSERRTARKPATKYPHLRKKLQKGKVKATTAKRK